MGIGWSESGLVGFVKRWCENIKGIWRVQNSVG